MSNLFNELKRRNVFRVAIGYLVLAWLLVQVGDIMFDAFEAPAWVMRVLIGFLALGFPVAVFLSWAFELTPEGIKLEKDVDRSQSVTPQTGRKLDFFIIGVLAVAVVYFAIDKFFLPPGVSNGEQVAEAEAQQLSIAVLPFANMSADEENEHFCDGLSEELLNVLAKIENLKVAGRTSSFHFKGQNPDLREVGLKLGVDHILEGSVRKSGNNVRITAQLIKADDGFHLWSETYDRQLNDIFAIQDEIAAAVATALKAKLLGEDQSVVMAQAMIAAEDYARFISARSRIQEGGRANYLAAFEALEQVIENSPDYAPAYAALAIAAIQRGRNTNTLSTEDAREIAREAMDKALALAPNDDYVLTANGVYRSELVENSNDAGLRRVNEQFRRALEINPENRDAMYFLAFNLRYLEDYEEAKEILDAALRIDPVDAAVRDLMVWTLMEHGDIDEAIELSLQSHELFPDDDGFFFRSAFAELVRGRPERALAWFYKIIDEGGGVGPFIHFRILDIARALEFEDGVMKAQEALTTNPIGEDFFELSALGEAGQWDEALVRIREFIRRDGWARWERELFEVAAHAGDCDGAFESRFSGRLWREWSEGDTTVDATNDNRAAWAAWCLQQKGLNEQAEKLLNALIAYSAPRQDRFDEPGFRLRRMAAYSLLNESDQALQEFQAYYDAGMGYLPFVALESDVRYNSMTSNPRFQDILAAIKARNERRLARMIETDFDVSTPL